MSSGAIEIAGDIKGVQKLSRVLPKQLGTNVPMTSTEKKWWGILVLISLTAWCILLFAKDYLNAILKTGNFFVGFLVNLFGVTLIAVAAISFLYLVIGLFDFVLNLFTVRNKIPKGLEKFSEE